MTLEKLHTEIKAYQTFFKYKGETYAFSWSDWDGLELCQGAKILAWDILDEVTGNDLSELEGLYCNIQNKDDEYYEQFSEYMNKFVELNAFR